MWPWQQCQCLGWWWPGGGGGRQLRPQLTVARAPPVTSAVASSLASDHGLVLILLHPPHQPPDPDNQTVSAGD